MGTEWKDGDECKATEFMINCNSIHKQLQRKCNKKHEHQALVGGRAAWAARYPPPLSKAICLGLVEAVEEQKMNVKALFRLSAETKGKEEWKDQAEAWHDRRRKSGSRHGMM